jgi:hypothetical protein
MRDIPPPPDPRSMSHKIELQTFNLPTGCIGYSPIAAISKQGCRLSVRCTRNEKKVIVEVRQTFPRPPNGDSEIIPVFPPPAAYSASGRFHGGAKLIGNAKRQTVVFQVSVWVRRPLCSAC